MHKLQFLVLILSKAKSPKCKYLNFMKFIKGCTPFSYTINSTRTLLEIFKK